MFIENRILAGALPLDKGATPIDYIISPCGYAALGLSKLLHNPNRKALIINFELVTSFKNFINNKNTMIGDRVIVYLPSEPRLSLVIFKYLSFLLVNYNTPLSIILLSRLQPSWIYCSLRSLVSVRKLLSAVRIIKPDENKIKTLEIIRNQFDNVPLLEKLTKSERYNSQSFTEGITRRELEVVLGFLNGNGISEQSLNSNLSIKTLYNQKKSGLRKLSKQFPLLVKLLPGKERRKIQSDKASDNVRMEDIVFSEAVRRGLFFQMYQPVIDSEMNIKGFEVLSRWYQKGKILLPKEFSPQLHTMHSWILLTACVIKNAVEKIHYYQGEYWFSVNIPACLSGNPALLRILDAARKRLPTRELLGKLVLEFQEDIDWSKDHRPVEMLRKLNEKNYKVFLDDCFSDKNITFPVNNVNFSGYKLNASVINNFMQNTHYRYLIKGLVYYSHLVGSKCIAEGVDTYEKFIELKRIGVTAFQGYYISPPVLEEQLDTTFTQLSKLRLQP